MEEMMLLIESAKNWVSARAERRCRGERFERERGKGLENSPSGGRLIMRFTRLLHCRVEE